MAVCIHGNDATTCSWCEKSSAELLVERLYEGDGLYRVQTVEARAEDLRVQRWHATYNAALTGLHAFSSGFEGERHGVPLEDCHCMAVQAADLAHGPLVKP